MAKVSKKNPYGFGLKRRSDGGVRTVKPTKKALTVLKKLRKLFSDPKHWWEGGLQGGALNEYGVWIKAESYCVLGGIDKMLHPKAAARRYPYDSDGIKVASLLLETVNGAAGEDTGFDEVITVNDFLGCEAVLDMLDRTIAYAEAELAATA